MKKLKGIYAATVVPLNKNKSIDKKSLNIHIKNIINTTGIRGLLLNGHAGENFTLTANEQIEIIKVAKKYKKDDKKIISGLNFEDSTFASMVAKNMVKAGADAILIFPPFSWVQGVTSDMIFNHHKIICNQIKKPVFLYQSSIYSGHLSYKKETLKKLLKINNVLGVKEGSWNYKSYVNNYNFFKKNKKNNNFHYHLLGSGIFLWFIWQLSTLTGVILGPIIPEELGLNFAIPLTFLAILVNEFQKLKNVLVMLLSGIVATVGYNIVPFKAYIIVAALTGLLFAAFLTNREVKKK